MQLTGDRGAKALLRAVDGLTRVPMDSAAYDVDTPDDLARLARTLTS
ncbi:MAG: nucleotidyltransferase family protein, partial [Gammaproteobacteria bacterium]|nr:nucleotidyltransferase family protein [Gammaproteobacteria bacterium]NBP08871.1 nucleotidyltransferase family protein [Gammaproteobacteria bacterium]